MSTFQMRDKLKERLNHLDVDFKLNREEETLRIYRTDNNKGIMIKFNAIVAKYEDRKEKIVDETVYYVNETIAQMADETLGSISSSQIVPVTRATSFDKKAKQGVPFIHDEHTAETVAYYAVDLGKLYRLIDESMLEDLKLTEQQIRGMSLFNARKLSNSYTIDEVKGNTFCFINLNDGYDVSRILNTASLNEIEAQRQGEMLVAVLHQDVSTIADIRNKIGYDAMVYLTMEFFTKGLVPITSLPSGYEQGHLEPIFILGKNNKQKRDSNVIQRLGANRRRLNKGKQK